MKTKNITIEGIPFTEGMLEVLKEWLVPIGEHTSARITCDLDLIERTQSFLLSNWEDLEDEENNVKSFLIDLQDLRDRFKLLQEGGAQ